MAQKQSAEKFMEPEAQALLELENFIASNPGSSVPSVLKY